MSESREGELVADKNGCRRFPFETSSFTVKHLGLSLNLFCLYGTTVRSAFGFAAGVIYFFWQAEGAGHDEGSCRDPTDLVRTEPSPRTEAKGPSESQPPAARP